MRRVIAAYEYSIADGIPTTAATFLIAAKRQMVG
jgi:hypothetical protein